MQSVRGVERTFGRHDKRGLNLCIQVREGILKHDSDGWSGKDGQWNCEHLRPKEPGTLEMQLCYWADKVAYVTHDWEDFVELGLLREGSLEGAVSEQEINEMWFNLVGLPQGDDKSDYIGMDLLRHPYQIRDLVRSLCIKLLEGTRANLTQYRPASSEDVRRLTAQRINYDGLAPRDALLVNFPNEYRRDFLRFRDFLSRHYIKSPTISRMDRKAERIIERILCIYMGNPDMLPWKTRRLYAEAEKSGVTDPRRVVIDHIAGMTDRYALEIYRDMFAAGRKRL